MVFVEGLDYGVEIAGEVFHGSVPGGSAGFSLANIGSLNAAGGAREVALGIVAHHKDLVWVESHHLKLLEIVGGIGLAAGGVSHVRDELKGGVGQVAPTHAALDGPLGKAGVGKERAAQSCVLYGLESGVCARHGVGVDDIVILVWKNFAVVVGKRLVDDRIGEADAASALDFGAVKLKIGAVVRAASAVGVEVDQDGAEACHRATAAAASDIREHRRDILKIAKDERVEVDAKKRLVHIENDCFEHAGTFLEKSFQKRWLRILYRKAVCLTAYRQLMETVVHKIAKKSPYE